MLFPPKDTNHMTQAMLRCVIADDVRAWRELLSAWMSECGYECVLTVDGEAAREAIEAAPTDLLITDIEMPKCSGLELLTRIRNHRSSQIQQVPVVVISSLHDDELVDIVERFGGNYAFVKPLERLLIQEAVHQLQKRPIVAPDKHHLPKKQSLLSKTVSPKLRRLAEEAVVKCTTIF
jgi:CheY-like chemotaxis protein